MDPKQLKKQFDSKHAAALGQKAAADAQAEQERAKRQQRDQEARTALRDVVIPYFTKVRADFPEFRFDIRSIDASDQAPVSVAFRVGSSRTHVIEVLGGRVSIFELALDAPKGFDIQVRWPADADPGISKPSDLTPDKLGKLIETVIAKS
jgi:hypothetical protein